MTYLPYTAPLDTRYDAEASAKLGRDHWRVITPFRYFLGENHSNEWVTIPAGYLTDGASVPQLLWNMLPPWGAYGQAAVVHDFLCEYLSITVDGLPQDITRTRCDQILYEAMQVLGVPAWKAWTIYHGVSMYRVAFNVDKPSNTPLKRQLESLWVAELATTQTATGEMTA